MSEKVRADMGAPCALVDADQYDRVMKERDLLLELIVLARKRHPEEFTGRNQRAGCNCGVCLFIGRVEEARSQGLPI